MADSFNVRNQSRWDEILRATKGLLLAVQEDRWDDLQSQAEYRDKLIRDYFSPPLNVDMAILAREEIAHILAIDEQILGYARLQQEQIGMHLKQLRNGSNAINTYSSVAG